MKNLLTKAALTAVVFYGTITYSSAQGVNISVAMDEVNIMSSKRLGAEGSPYLYKSWAKGSVTLTNGAVFEGMKLLYDQMEDELIFKADSNKPQAFAQPVKEFTIQEPESEAVINERKFRNGFPSVDGANANSFYEILVDGETQLLKRTSKVIVEERPDGSVVKSKQIKDNVKYYLASSGNLVKLKKDKKSVLAALGTNSTELESYLKEKQLNLKEETGLVKLVEYYNSLN